MFDPDLRDAPVAEPPRRLRERRIHEHDARVDVRREHGVEVLCVLAEERPLGVLAPFLQEDTQEVGPPFGQLVGEALEPQAERPREERPCSRRGFQHHVSRLKGCCPGTREGVRRWRRELLERLLLLRAPRLARKEPHQPLGFCYALQRPPYPTVHHDVGEVTAKQNEVESEFGRVVGLAGQERPFGEGAPEEVRRQKEELLGGQSFSPINALGDGRGETGSRQSFTGSR